MDRPVLDTHGKAQSINQDRRKYGTLAEIGAGKETARWFFRVGGAAGTIAKAISAYDMQVSDSLYGPCRRYVSRENTLVLSEMTLHNLGNRDDIDVEDFLNRVEILCAHGKNVIITDYGEFYRLAQYLFRLTQEPVGVVLGVTTLAEIFNESYYRHLDGGILESFGRMFRQRLHLYVCPACQDETDQLLTAGNLMVEPHLRHLYSHLLENGCIRELTDISPDNLKIHSHTVLDCIRSGATGWESMVPAIVADLIRERRLFRHACTSDAAG